MKWDLDGGNHHQAAAESGKLTSSSILHRLHDYQAELHDKTQGIIHAKLKAVEDLKWVKENVEKMEEALSAFRNAQQQVSADKKVLAEELVIIEKRMAERTVEVEARLKDAAATVVGLRQKLGALEKELKAAKSKRLEGKVAEGSHPTRGRSANDRRGRGEQLKEKLEAAEEQLQNDSDLITKLYDRICALNSNLVEARIKRVEPRDNCTSHAERYEHAADTRSHSPSQADAEAERIFTTAGRTMEAAGLKLHDASEKVEAAEVQVQDATRTISQLRERVRVLTDEVKKSRGGSPTSSHSEGALSTLVPPLSLDEPPSVTARKLEEAIMQAQERCNFLTQEIDYMEQKKIAAVDAIKTLDAAIADKQNQLKVAGQDVRQMKRSTKRNSAEPSKNKGGFRIFKMFQRSKRPNLEKYMIKQQLRSV